MGTNGKPYQRPWCAGGLADPEISLHDKIMRDDFNDEEKLSEILHKWEVAHGNS